MVEEREAIHIFLSELLMDLLAYATGLKCRFSYRARQGRIVVPFHQIHIHRFLKTGAQTCASGIAMSMLHDKRPVDVKIIDSLVTTTLTS